MVFSSWFSSGSRLSPRSMRYRSLIPEATGRLGFEAATAILTQGFLFERPSPRFDFAL
jgi:hypothetical protein